jgi:hypothetical protein
MEGNMPANTYKKLCPVCNRKKRFHDAQEASAKGWTKRALENGDV